MKKALVIIGILVVVAMIIGPYVWVGRHPEVDWLVVIAQWVSAAFVLLAALVAWGQLLDSQATARFEAVMRLIESANSPDVLNAERIVVYRKGQGFFSDQAYFEKRMRQLTAEERLEINSAIQRVSAVFDLMGTVVRYKRVDAEVLMDYLGVRVAGLWEILRPILEAQRIHIDGTNADFERFASECRAFNQKHGRVFQRDRVIQYLEKHPDFRESVTKEVEKRGGQMPNA